MYIPYERAVKIKDNSKYIGREFNLIDVNKDREGNYTYTLRDKETGEVLDEEFYIEELEEV